MFLSFTDHYCYNSTGQLYRGTVSTTLSGFRCQKWTDSHPHHHFLTTANHPEIGNHNYCRNPGNRESGPWCFTTDERVRIELCDIPKCGMYI